MSLLNKQTLSEQIYEIIRDDILNGKIEQGSKLTLKALQDRFGVSSTPVREALSKIVEDGLADYITNVGINVVRLSENDIRELFEYMGDLDALAIKYASSHPDQAALLNELTQNIKDSDALFTHEKLSYSEKEKWIHLSDGFHTVFYEYCDNSRLKAAAERQRCQLSIFSNKYESLPEVQREIEAGHKEIYEAYTLGNVSKACELMKEHLNQSMQYAFHFMK